MAFFEEQDWGASTEVKHLENGLFGSDTKNVKIRKKRRSVNGTADSIPKRCRGPRPKKVVDKAEANASAEKKRKKTRRGKRRRFSKTVDGGGCVNIEEGVDEIGTVVAKKARTLEDDNPHEKRLKLKRKNKKELDRKLKRRGPRNKYKHLAIKNKETEAEGLTIEAEKNKKKEKAESILINQSNVDSEDKTSDKRRGSKDASPRSEGGNAVIGNKRNGRKEPLLVEQKTKAVPQIESLNECGSSTLKFSYAKKKEKARVDSPDCPHSKQDGTKSRKVKRKAEEMILAVTSKSPLENARKKNKSKSNAQSSAVFEDESQIEGQKNTIEEHERNNDEFVRKNKNIPGFKSVKKIKLPVKLDDSVPAVEFKDMQLNPKQSQKPVKSQLNVKQLKNIFQSEKKYEKEGDRRQDDSLTEKVQNYENSPKKKPKDKKSPDNLRDRMKAQLSAARFRYLNEKLYTCTSQEALELMNGDHDAFKVYHEGFQSQVSKWPQNPVDRVIKYVRQRPMAEIADFGCGDAKLAQNVKNKVHSFDLVAVNDDVLACNMAHVPLGSESVDIAVFCLSLMGTDLVSFICEANRVLKPKGTLLVAEVVSRFEKVGAFVRKMSKLGFDLVQKDDSNKMFVWFEFTKFSSPASPDHLPEIELSSCTYKKR